MTENPPCWWSWSSLRPLFRGLGQRLLLLSIVGLIVLIAAADFGDSFGVPQLFWHQDWKVQALAGLAVALLFAHICLIGYLLDVAKPWLHDLPEDAPADGHQSFWRFLDRVLRALVPQPRGEPQDVRQWRQLRWYLSVTWLPLLALLVVPALLEYRERWGFLVGLAAALAVLGTYVCTYQWLSAAGVPRRMQEVLARLPNPWVMGPLLFAMLVLLLVVAGAFPAARVYFVLLLGLWLGIVGAYAGAVRYKSVPEEQRWIHGLAGAGFGTFYILYQALFLVTLFAPNWAALLVPPAVTLCLLLTLIVAGHGFLKFHFGGFYTALAFAVVLLAVGVAGFSGYRHQLRGLDYGPDDLLDLQAADFQVEAVAGKGDDNATLARLKNSYKRLHARYLNSRGKLDTGEAVPFVEGLATVQDVQAEQAKLRKAMVALDVARLDHWKAGVAKNKGDKPKLAVVTVTGGANRSAVWTAHTLTQLERGLGASGIPFNRHVRLVTGASGGMVGASYFVATLPGPHGHGHKSDAEAEAFVRKVGQDALTPLTHRLLFFDIPGMFVPGGSTNDRGLALEEAWDQHLGGALEKSFADLAPGEAEGWRPSLVLSPMIVEDGRRLLISNLYLSQLVETTGSFLTAPPVADDGGTSQPAAGKQTPRPRGRFINAPRYSLTGLEFFQLFPSALGKFPLSTAVRLNASFPYVSPVAALPTNPARHVVDAGYYDNYGVNLAAWWLYHHYEWLVENTSGIAVIQIRDQVSERLRVTPLTDPAAAKVWDLNQGLQSITGPAIGASNALQAIMSFRNDEQLQVLHDWFNADAPAASPFFTTVVFECPEPIALSWYLSDRDIVKLTHGFAPGDGNYLALRKLQEWFKR